ncbi:MarR family winged helix-turn-helix transcriptional regulator [Phaeobacter sp. QD34_3]|uniref:MarR family winged helix-turn-helix transcriptional regulator n=1 Tax=unclassified Phaeobacter TaxID=2621772 RepID=UPI00237F4AC9|nr:MULTISPECIES: MarR family winged helix-turn-helix transcriptional regulator [unclassified Phaeobacter]MDE4131842.1 MarR family winged helix-turn-helix transcriptional regulator [Phaeobacter sp. QD34_3]MDE4135480.1 MarR family winged helix-turn-helix transcriptional regulator [Phaeobacter sp. QD34_24]
MSDFKQSSAGFLANHMARLFASTLHRKIASLGIAPAQFMVLLELWQGDERTQADLTAALAVEQATMANTLARMERDGLIEKRPSQTDKRSKMICLTAKAEALQEAAIAAAAGVNDTALAGLTAKDRQQFLVLMARVIRNLQAG